MKITQAKLNELRGKLAMWVHADEILLNSIGNIKPDITYTDVSNARNDAICRYKSDAVFARKVTQLSNVVIKTLDIRVAGREYTCSWCKDKGVYDKTVPGTHGREREEIPCHHCK
jgi:hypothetical protein